jgi:hypothetical protein
LKLKPLAAYAIPIMKEKILKSDSGIDVNNESRSVVSDDNQLRRRKVEGVDNSSNVSENASSGVNLKMTESNRVKFVISAWKFTNFSITSIMGLMLLSQEYEWMMTPQLYFKGLETHPMSDLLKLFYQMGYASYAYATFTVFIEPKQKDFLVMVIHHLTTLFLIHFSLMSGFFRIGAVILLLHEVSDPFMEIAKMLFYAQFKKVTDPS